MYCSRNAQIARDLLNCLVVAGIIGMVVNLDGEGLANQVIVKIFNCGNNSQAFQFSGK